MIRQFIRDTALAAMLLTGVFTTAAAATCTIHLRIAQSGQHPISFNVSQVEVRARTAAAHVNPNDMLNPFGPWIRVYRDSFLNQIYRQNEVVYLNPGQSVDGHYYANLGCGHDREFRVAYRCRGGIYAATNYTFGREVSLAGIRNAPRIVNLGTIGLGGRCR